MHLYTTCPMYIYLLMQHVPADERSAPRHSLAVLTISPPKCKLSSCAHHHFTTVPILFLKASVAPWLQVPASHSAVALTRPLLGGAPALQQIQCLITECILCRTSTPSWSSGRAAGGAARRSACLRGLQRSVCCILLHALHWPKPHIKHALELCGSWLACSQDISSWPSRYALCCREQRGPMLPESD